LRLGFFEGAGRGRGVWILGRRRLRAGGGIGPFHGGFDPVVLRHGLVFWHGSMF
jgi:hypothetical protein